MDKPLRDWTLGEVQANCAASDDCSECDFGKKRGGKCELCRATPGDWDLTAPRCFTPDEAQLAFVLMRLFPLYHFVVRHQDGSLFLERGPQRSHPLLIPKNEFPSLPVGSDAALSEIAGCGDAR
jgi:hypothetical protein